MSEDESTAARPLPRRERRRAWERLRTGTQRVRRVGAGALIVLVGAGAVAAGAASAALGDAGAVDSAAEEWPADAGVDAAVGRGGADPVSEDASSAAETSGPPAGIERADPPPPGDTAGIVVHVIGAVERPGTVRLPAGSRVQDAIAAVGGGAENADPASVNLARPLQDGEQLLLARIGESARVPPGGEPSSPGASAADGGARVRLNSATAAELESLPGVGAATAEKILRWRDEHGGFRAVADLLDIPGIGQRRFAELEDRVQL